jgi:putative membrane protein
MKTKNIMAAAFMLCAMATVPTFAQKDNKDSKKQAEKQNDKKFEDTKLDKDADFVVAAADAGMFEVQAAALAKTNASDPKVKELAQHMTADHSKANEELKSLAAKKNMTLPTKLSNKMQDKFDKLTKLKGQEFDEEYAEMMVSDHKDVIDMFEKEAEKGMDGELKAWAAAKVSTLKHHLEMSKETEKVVDDNKDKGDGKLNNQN